jgi:glutathionylspermidine synthase
MKYFDSIFKAAPSTSFMSDINALSLEYVTMDGKNYGISWKQGLNYMSCLFNNYPKEWMINEMDQDGLLKYDLENLNSFEPFWKLILANKAILPFLY